MHLCSCFNKSRTQFNDSNFYYYQHSTNTLEHALNLLKMYDNEHVFRNVVLLSEKFNPL
jgi:radical SAM superfamily enzyme